MPSTASTRPALLRDLDVEVVASAAVAELLAELDPAKVIPPTRDELDAFAAAIRRVGDWAKNGRWHPSWGGFSEGSSYFVDKNTIMLRAFTMEQREALAGVLVERDASTPLEVIMDAATCRYVLKIGSPVTRFALGALAGVLGGEVAAQIRLGRSNSGKTIPPDLATMWLSTRGVPGF